MSRESPPRAVVFDLDGTLLDSLPLVLAAIAHALEPFGAPRTTMEIFGRLGGPPARFLPALLDDLRHAPVAIERMEMYHDENTHLIRVFDGVPRLLEELRAGGVQVAVWTGRDRKSTERLLRAHALDGYFHAILCGDDLPTHKPDPAGLVEILRQLGVAPADALFVGDADVDVLGGVACGVSTILIRHAREIEAHIVSQSWQVVASPTDAFQKVLGWIAPGDVSPADVSNDVIAPESA